MKTNFSRGRVVAPAWNDNKTLPEAEQIKFLYKPMTTGDFNELMEALRAAKIANEADAQKAAEAAKSSRDRQDEFVKLLVDFVGTYVEFAPKSAPLLPAEGVDPVTMKEVATLSPFFTLAAELLWSLVEASAPADLDRGN